MKNKHLNYLSKARLAMAFSAVMLFMLTGVYRGGASAESQFSPAAELSDKVDSSDVTVALGKLTFSQLVFTFGSPNLFVKTANADGSGEIGLTGTIPPSDDPSWSPDGSKIVYSAFGPFDIFSMNADGSNKVNLTNTQSGNERNAVWSAVGKIAYERDGQIWTMNANGSNQALFSSITQPSPLSPAWSFDGAKLAFTSGDEVWTINADGTNQRRVTNNLTTDTNPAWSGDGTKIAFSKGSGIAVINIDGTNEISLTSGDDREPSWSSDNTKIAFVRKGTTVNGIYTMDVNGANQLRVIADVQTTRGTENNSPMWQPVAVPVSTSVINGRITRVGASLSGVTVTLSGSVSATTTTDSTGSYQFNNLPNGGNYTITPTLANNIFTPPNRTFNNLNANQIADFTAAAACSGTNCIANGKIAYAANDSNIYTASPDGTNVVQLTNVNGDNEPIWSPDGAKIVFQSSRDILTAPEIYSINADGTGLTRLTNNTNEDEYPSFSPDGTKILFVSNRDGNREIYRMNADGTNQVRLTNDVSDDRYPKYSPDGTKIVFTRFLSNSRGLHTMNADGTNVVQITTPPGGNMDNNGSYSPDGTKIVFIRGNGGPPANQIYTVNSDGSSPTLLVANGFNYKPSYAPDGTKILFTSVGGSTYYVQTVSLNGNNNQLLFTGGTRADWQPMRAAIRPTRFDFDGDGRADVSVFRPSNGVWYLNQSQNGFSGTAFGLSTDKLTPADYDGDGKTDIAVYRSGTWYLQRSRDGFTGIGFGAADDVPVPADYDGDGKADIAVFRPSNGTWYLLQSTNGFAATAFGVSTDKPVPADYNGDGKAEVALFRPSNGTWYLSTDPAVNYGAVLFGASGDVPVPADYDGDGKTDVAVFRNGTWYLNRSSDGFSGVAFGLGTDLPTAADYDGDGKADIAVFRNGTWYLNRSTSGFTGIAFGEATDKPLPNAFVR